MIKESHLHPLPWFAEFAAQLVLKKIQGASSHAYILVGRQGIGCESMLHSMAAALLCQNLPTEGVNQGLACGQCASCLLLNSYNHPDLMVLRPSQMDLDHPVLELRPEKGSKYILIGDVRAVTQRLEVSAFTSARKVVVIYPAHKMNEGAANALLKSLEEPSHDVVFLFYTHDVKLMLPTILSRCQTLHLPEPTLAQAVLYLKNLDAQTNWEAALHREGMAVMRLAQMHDSEYLTLQLQMIEKLKMGAQFDAIELAADLDKHLKPAKDRLNSQQISMDDYLVWIQRWVHDVISTNLGAAARYHVTQVEALGRLSEQLQSHGPIGVQQWQDYFQRLAQERQHADHPLNTKAWLETLLLEYQLLFNRKKPSQA